MTNVAEPSGGGRGGATGNVGTTGSGVERLPAAARLKANFGIEPGAAGAKTAQNAFPPAIQSYRFSCSAPPQVRIPSDPSSIRSGGVSQRETLSTSERPAQARARGPRGGNAEAAMLIAVPVTWNVRTCSCPAASRRRHVQAMPS